MLLECPVQLSKALCQAFLQQPRRVTGWGRLASTCPCTHQRPSVDTMCTVHARQDALGTSHTMD
eukprot:14924599-Alexandrium_andersonii.AAC.1